MADMTKAERIKWLEERKLGIGGTDVAKILGASKYGTELSVWLDKTGVSPDEEEDNFAMWWGRESEET